MNLSVTERERILETVHENLMGFIYDEISGVPEIRRRLQAHGLKLKITIEMEIGEDSGAAEPMPAGADDELDEWRNMGISLDDLREVAQAETRRCEEEVKGLVEQIWEVAGSLSPRGRNYSWGWLHLYYPETGLGKNPVSQRDERFALLSGAGYWQNIIERVLRAVSNRRDGKEILRRFLFTLKFAKANT